MSRYSRRYVALDALEKIARCPGCGFVDTPAKREAWWQRFADSSVAPTTHSAHDLADRSLTDGEPFDWPLCPLCACPINECHRDGCCALTKRSEEA